jgi:hypothetical protein
MALRLKDKERKKIRDPNYRSDSGRDHLQASIAQGKPY